MKIIFMGTPDFAVPALEAIVAGGHEVVAVYTQKPKAANRGLQITKSKVHEFAESKALPVFTPDSLKTVEEQEKFAALGADVAVVAAYGMLLPKEILQAPKSGCINIHPSMLPRWRGAAPLQRTLMLGDKKSAVCIMQMDIGLDTGDVILKEEFDIPPEADCGWLHDFCAGLGAKLTMQALKQIEKGEAQATKQLEVGVVYAKKITKEDEKIDFNTKGEDIINKIRALSPFPGANFMLDGKKYKIFKAHFLPTSVVIPSEVEGSTQDNNCGIVLNQNLYISCLDGAIAPEIIQKEGKGRMAIEEFLRGNKIEVGGKIASSPILT